MFLPFNYGTKYSLILVNIIFSLISDELNPGFRWRAAPYSCYNSISLLNVNGTLLDTTYESVTHRYTNIFEQDWYATDFVEDSNWKDHKASSTGDNYDVENTEITNTYWRIKIL